MKAFFEAIETIFVDFLFLPLDFFRELELGHWFIANFINWVFMIICAVAIVYWCKQLQLHKDNNEENQDTTAHSFLS
jgi:uncharacterized membrane protein